MERSTKIVLIAVIVVIASMLSVTFIASDHSSRAESYVAENGVIYELENDYCWVVGFDTLKAYGDVVIPSTVFDGKGTPIIVKGFKNIGEKVIVAKITSLTIYVDEKCSTYEMAKIIQIPTLKSYALISHPNVNISADLPGCLSYCPNITDISIECRGMQFNMEQLGDMPSIEHLKLIGVGDSDHRWKFTGQCESQSLKEVHIGSVEVGSNTFYNCPNLNKVTIGDYVTLYDYAFNNDRIDGHLGESHFIKIGNSCKFGNNVFYTKNPTASGFVIGEKLQSLYGDEYISDVFGYAKGSYEFKSSDTEEKLEYISEISGRTFSGSNGSMKETSDYIVSFQIEGDGSLNVDSVSIPVSVNAIVTVDEFNKNKLVISWGSSSKSVIAIPESDTEFICWDSVPPQIDGNMTIKAIFTKSPGPAPTPTPTPSGGDGLSIDPTVAFAVVVVVFIAAMLGLAFVVKKK